jgi:chemotaxis protein MotB
MARTRLPRQAEEGEHGGAWKVAYADFVTALMALFIVLWLMNSAPRVKQAIGHYFRNPHGRSGLQEGAGGWAKGPAPGGAGTALEINTKNVHQLETRLKQSMRDLPQFHNFESFVQFTVSDEGLRIELMEDEGGMFFESGAPRLTSRGETLFRMLAQEIRKLPNSIVIEGHTDSRAFRSNALDAYGNWELSFDRANMTRRLMVANGVPDEHISEIRGYADRQTLVAGDPADSRNRRVSVVLKYGKE